MYIDSTQQPEIELSDNFIVSLYQVSAKIEDNAHGFVNDANRREKDLEKSWKGSNSKKAQLQREQLVNISKNMAYLSSMLLVLSMSSLVGNTILSAKGQQAIGDLLGHVGSMASNQGQGIAQHVSGIYSQTAMSTIEELTQTAQKIWEGDKRENEARKQDLNETEKTIRNGLQAAMEKAAGAYTYRG